MVAYEVLQHSLHGTVKRSKYNFITDRGQLGVTPANVVPDDLVVALFGGEVQYLLRREEEGGTYQSVSECYLHGFMDGECLINAQKAAGLKIDIDSATWLEQLDPNCLSFPVQEFHIR